MKEPIFRKIGQNPISVPSYKFAEGFWERWEDKLLQGMPKQILNESLQIVENQAYQFLYWCFVGNGGMTHNIP